jgi:hypothetical protein
LIYLTKNFPTIKKSVYLATSSILQGKTRSLTSIKKNLDMEHVNLYGAIRGFMLSCYPINPCAYVEIIDILKNEGHTIEAISTAGQWIGAYIGLIKLLEQGLKMT